MATMDAERIGQAIEYAGNCVSNAAKTMRDAMLIVTDKLLDESLRWRSLYNDQLQTQRGIESMDENGD